MLTNKEISNIQITWKTLSFPEMKSRLQELYHSDMSFLDLVSALYWDLIETKHKYYHESTKFGNNRATLEEIAELEEAKQLLKSAIDEWHIVCEWGNCGEYCGWYVNGQCTQKWSGESAALKLIGETNGKP